MALDMNPGVRAQWCAALRSGDYQQSGGQLRVGTQQIGYAYCCLGVLTDLAVKDGMLEWDEDLALASYLSDEVCAYANLDRRDPYLDANTLATTANDWQHRTFAEIADLIDGGAQ